MNLLIDIGNSLTKLAMADGQKIIPLQTFHDPSLLDFDYILSQLEQPENCILSGSGEILPGLHEMLASRFSKVIQLTHHTPVPVKLQYETKESLGMDRLAAVVGAHTIHPGQNCLIIDTGTAITIDLVTKNGFFMGGNISPGIRLRFLSLHEHTARLPLLEPEGDFPLLGSSTEKAIRSGILNGVKYELQGYVEELQKNYSPLLVILTGGDALLLSKYLQPGIIVDLNLIFAGLNRILEFNTTN